MELTIVSFLTACFTVALVQCVLVFTQDVYEDVYKQEIYEVTELNPGHVVTSIPTNFCSFYFQVVECMRETVHLHIFCNNYSICL